MSVDPIVHLQVLLDGKPTRTEIQYAAFHLMGWLMEQEVLNQKFLAHLEAQAKTPENWTQRWLAIRDAAEAASKPSLPDTIGPTTKPSPSPGASRVLPSELSRLTLRILESSRLTSYTEGELVVMWQNYWMLGSTLQSLTQSGGTSLGNRGRAVRDEVLARVWDNPADETYNDTGLAPDSTKSPTGGE